MNQSVLTCASVAAMSVLDALELLPRSSIVLVGRMMRATSLAMGLGQAMTGASGSHSCHHKLYCVEQRRLMSCLTRKSCYQLDSYQSEPAVCY